MKPAPPQRTSYSVTSITCGQGTLSSLPPTTTPSSAPTAKAGSKRVLLGSTSAHHRLKKPSCSFGSTNNFRPPSPNQSRSVPFLKVVCQPKASTCAPASKMPMATSPLEVRAARAERRWQHEAQKLHLSREQKRRWQINAKEIPHR